MEQIDFYYKNSPNWHTFPYILQTFIGLCAPVIVLGTRDEYESDALSLAFSGRAVFMLCSWSAGSGLCLTSKAISPINDIPTEAAIRKSWP